MCICIYTCIHYQLWNHLTQYYSIRGHPNFILHNSSFERVEQFKYLGKTLTNQNSILEEIKRLRSGNACYCLVPNLLSSTLLSKNIKIKIYRTIIVSVVSYGCETWLLKLREECRLRVFEKRVGAEDGIWHKRDKITEEWRKLNNEELADMYSSPNIIQVIREK